MTKVPSSSGATVGGNIDPSDLDPTADATLPTRIRSINRYSGPQLSFPTTYVAVNENHIISPMRNSGRSLSLISINLPFSYDKRLGLSGLGIHLELAGSSKAFWIQGWTLYGTLKGCPSE